MSAGFIAEDSQLGKEATRLIAMPPKKQTRGKQKIPPVSRKPIPKMNFGKFKEKPLDEVPLPYLKWALKKGFLKGVAREAANRLLGNHVSEGRFPSAGPFGPPVEPGLDCPFDCPEDEDEKKFIRMVRGF